MRPDHVYLSTNIWLIKIKLLYFADNIVWFKFVTASHRNPTVSLTLQLKLVFAIFHCVTQFASIFSGKSLLCQFFQESHSHKKAPLVSKWLAPVWGRRDQEAPVKILLKVGCKLNVGESDIKNDFFYNFFVWEAPEKILSKLNLERIIKRKISNVSKFGKFICARKLDFRSSHSF